MDGFANAFPGSGKAFRFFCGVNLQSVTAVMRMARLLLASVLWVALGIFVQGCGRAIHRADVVIVNGGEPETLDPAIVTVQADLRLVRALFEGLVRLNPTNAEPAPGLAYQWKISPDGLTYTFNLRSNLVWSTGEPITSADV